MPARKSTLLTGKMGYDFLREGAMIKRLIVKTGGFLFIIQCFLFYQLLTAKVIFFDDFSVFPGAWLSTGTVAPVNFWTLSTSRTYSAPYSVKCSTYGESYNNNVNVWIERRIDLTGYDEARLSFRAWVDTEWWWDVFYVEYSTDVVGPWHIMWSRDGRHRMWEKWVLNISTTAKRIRFRFTSNAFVTYEGVYVDDVLLEANTFPTLSWTDEIGYTTDDVHPEEGDSAIRFTFRIKYTDLNNDMPADGYPKLVLHRTHAWGTDVVGKYTMSEVDVNDTDYKDGKLYTLSITLLALPYGTAYRYNFETKDTFESPLVSTLVKEGPTVHKKTAIISGYVRDFYNNPISGVEITLTGAIERKVYTGADGSYRFDFLDAGGSYKITPRKFGYTFSPAYMDYSPLISDKLEQNFTGLTSETIIESRAGWLSKFIASREYKLFDSSQDKILFLTNPNEETTQVDIFVMNFDGTEKRQLTNDNLFEKDAKFIPGKNKIVYTAFDDASPGSYIYTINLDGSRRTLIHYSPVLIYTLSVSPDGSKVAFTTGDNMLSVVNVDGKEFKILASDSAPHLPYSWAPNSKDIAYTSAGQIKIVNVETRATRVLRWGSEPQWSLSKNLILYSEGNYICIMSSDGVGYARLTPYAAYYSKPKWSPCGRKICYMKLNEIWVRDVFKEMSTLILKLATIDDFVFSPKSDKVICSTLKNIYTIRIDNPDLKKNLTNNNLPIKTELRDVRTKVVYLAYHEEKVELRVSDFIGRDAILDKVSIAADVLAPPFQQLVISPDGSVVAYIRPDGTLFMKNLDTGYTELAITPPFRSHYTSISWAGDSRKIVCEYKYYDRGKDQTRDYIVVFSRRDPTGKSVVSGDDSGFSPIFSGDGTKIVFRGTINGIPGIYMMDPDGKNKQKIAPHNVTSFKFAPSGVKLAYVYEKNLWIYQHGVKEKVVLTDVDEVISWSPDSLRVACRKGGEIVVIDPGTDLRYKFDAEHSCWAGSKIAYIESLPNKTQAIVVSYPNGRERQQLTHGAYYLGFYGDRILSSADGTRVFFNYVGNICVANIYSEHRAKLTKEKLLLVNNLLKPAEGRACSIYYYMPSAGHVTIRIYTIDGVLVKTLVDKYVPEGTHIENWYGRNMNDEVVASGIYYVHIEGPGFKQTKKICVVR